MVKRNLYLSNTPVDEALDKYLKHLKGKVTYSLEKIPVIESLGRLTASAVYASCCSPLFNSSAMDGIAVISKATHGASEVNPIVLEEVKDFIVVDTGDPVEAPYDAVIMIENIQELGDGKVQIIAPIAPWDNIRPIGEDIVEGEMILPGFHKIRAIDIGVLLSAGISELEVLRRPRVGIFPTGTELIEPDQEPVLGSIIESNSRMFENMVIENGGLATRYPIIADDYEEIKQRVKEALVDNDIVIINAGSSAGREDYTVHVLEELGRVIVHGVAIKPGKPVILAEIDGKPVIGLPGYPVSAYIGFINFLVPVLRLFMDGKNKQNNLVDAVISKRMISSLKHKEYVRVKLGRVGDKLVASPLARGAGAAMSLIRADGFCVIEQNSEGVEAGDLVKVELYRPKEEIDNTLVSIGSHDLILDILADEMSRAKGAYYLSSSHVGSMGGLMAMKRGETHLVPIHLLDEKNGEYNISYVKKLFDQPMALIKGVKRIQGIMVKHGNPLRINSLKDLVNVRFINRQRGAGTRILFDYLLKKEGISPDQIQGYDFEASTHMALAAMVQSPNADAGIGILSAAKAMDLDFIPVGKEEYDFAIPVDYLEMPAVKQFIDVLKSEAFQERVKELGGYGFENCGEIIYI